MIDMYPLTTLTMSTCVVFMTYYTARFAIVAFMYGGLKYKIISMLSDHVYMDTFRVSTLLRLDSPESRVLRDRLVGYEYLCDRLSGGSTTHNRVCADSMTDCRFRKAKILTPVLRELEIPIPNYIEKVDSCDVVLKDGSKKLHISGNAVHYFNQAYYEDFNARVFRAISKSTNQYSFTSLTPEICDHTQRILSMTRMDQVRYALSGSEAVDIAMRDVRVSTGKRFIVRFKNAYHGHSSGPRNDAPNQIFLDECCDESLKFIEAYHYQIAGVIVNPMQHFTGPNRLSPPGEKLTTGKRCVDTMTRAAYTRWLHDLNRTCQYCTEYLTPIAFMMDDIYFAFRTKELFSYEYFSTPDQEIRPDVIVLGKGIAGGFPLSVVCGKNRFMNHYDKKFVLKVNTSVGTFSAWENGIVASNMFLKSVEEKTMPDEFDRINRKFEDFRDTLNGRLVEAVVPIRIRSFANVFTVDYLNDSLYNSMFPQFMMAEDDGVYFSNQTTGKFNLTDEWDDVALDRLCANIVAAATKWRDHGFAEPKRTRLWWAPLARQILANFVVIQYNQIMLDKHIDISVSHNHPFNRFGHFWSSIGMICICYPEMWRGNHVYAAMWFLATHGLRQAGHFFYERQDIHAEKRKFGHKDATKKVAAVFVFISIAMYVYRDQIGITRYADSNTIAAYMCLLTVIPHFCEIWHKFGLRRGVHWAIKIVTDPFTDILDFYSYAFIEPKWFIDWRK
jgi:glutamate-1-semialdehyde aminotransferase